MRMIAADSREPSEPVVVFRGRLVAVPGLQQRHHECVEVRPPSCIRSVFAEVIGERCRVGAESRHRNVAGQDVVERWNVGGSLDRGMTAEGEDPSTRTPDVAEEELEDRRGADDLHAGGMLRPSNRIADGTGALGSGGAAERVRDAQKRVAGDAADLLDHLRRVSRVMPLQDLKDASGMLQRRIAAADSSPDPSTSCGAPSPRSLRRLTRCARFAMVALPSHAHRAPPPAMSRACVRPLHRPSCPLHKCALTGPIPRKGHPVLRCRGSRER